MNGTIRLIVTLSLLSLSITIWNCGGSPNLRKEIPTTVNTVKSAKGHIKKIGMVLVYAPSTSVGQSVGGKYLKTLGDAVRDNNDPLDLLTPQDSEFPTFLAELADGSSMVVDAVALSEAGRQAGYQGLIVAAVSDIRAVAKKTGVLWMRKTRHFVHYTVVVDLYDPYTAAKIVSEVKEGAIKISEGDYDRLTAGTATAIDALNETIEDVAQDHGERIGQALADHLWKSAVASVQDGRIIIPAGRKTRLKEGDRLAVFEGRHVLKNSHGGIFTAPGIQIGEVEITAVDDHVVEAKALNKAAIQKGDIVIPIR